MSRIDLECRSCSSLVDRSGQTKFQVLIVRATRYEGDIFEEVGKAARGRGEFFLKKISFLWKKLKLYGDEVVPKIAQV